jgi:hypothetical protein
MLTPVHTTVGTASKGTSLDDNDLLAIYENLLTLPPDIGDIVKDVLGDLFARKDEIPTTEWLETLAAVQSVVKSRDESNMLRLALRTISRKVKPSDRDPRIKPSALYTDPPAPSPEGCSERADVAEFARAYALLRIEQAAHLGAFIETNGFFTKTAIICRIGTLDTDTGKFVPDHKTMRRLVADAIKDLLHHLGWVESASTADEVIKNIKGLRAAAQANAKRSCDAARQRANRTKN